MSKKKANEVEKEETALVNMEKSDVPAWLSPIPEDSPLSGLENMRPGDLLVPRLILLQGLSPQVVEGPKEAGQIINSITGDVWIDKDQTLEFIPLYHYLEWIRWGERETGEGILERSLEPEGSLAQMAMRKVKRSTSKGIEIFTVTEYHNFVAIFPKYSFEMPVIISCAKTNIKKGRKLLGLARYRGRYPLFAGKYVIQAIIETNSAGQKYYVFDFTNAGWVEEELYPVLEGLYKLIKEAYQQRKLLSHQMEETNPIEENEM